MPTIDEFTSKELLTVEERLKLPKMNLVESTILGDIAKENGILKNYPIAIEVSLGNWIVYHVSLPGSKPENQEWLDRKARVVNLKHHSTLYERVLAKEQDVDWYLENKLSQDSYSIHGGGLPLITVEQGFVGVLLTSGLPQVEDHLLGVEVLTAYLARKVV